VKATGAEILDFYTNHWPGDDWYIDDYAIDPAGEEGKPLNSGERYDLQDFGFICWQGKGDPPMKAPVRGSDSIEFEKWFMFWKKKQTTMSFAITIPNEDEATLKAVCKEHKWKVS